MKKLIKSVGNELRKIRQMKDLSLKDVADKAGVTSMYISEIERDKKTPSDELIKRLSDIYNVDEKALFESFGKVPEDMLIELTTYNDLFDIVFDASKGKLPEDKKIVLYQQIREMYKKLQDE